MAMLKYRRRLRMSLNEARSYREGIIDCRKLEAFCGAKMTPSRLQMAMDGYGIPRNPGIGIQKAIIKARNQ